VELVAGDPTQLREDCLAVRANGDVGKGGKERDGLLGIENQRPGACLMLDGFKRAGSLQRCYAGIGIEGERNVP
jgi:hypothetical protein